MAGRHISRLADLQRICSIHRQTMPAQGRWMKMVDRVLDLGHGGHVKSGKQTVEGRARINAATSKRMRAFWNDWRAAGRPPLPWRESLRTAKPRRTVTPPRARDTPKKDVVLTEEEKAFGRLIGLLKD